MTRLFDTALPPIWYIAFWIALLLATRLWIVNPLVQALRSVSR